MQVFPENWSGVCISITLMGRVVLYDAETIIGEHRRKEKV